MISNVLLFMPWGFLLGTWRIKCGTGFLAAMVLGLLSGFLLSGAVECAQLFTPSRTTSLLDLVTNTAGSTLGAAIGWPFVRRSGRPGWETQAVDRSSGPWRLALAVVAGLTVTALAPFDISVQVSELKTAIKNARLVPFGPTLDGAAAPVRPGPWPAICSSGCLPAVCSRWWRGRGQARRSSDSARCARGRWPLPGHRVDAIRHPEPSVRHEHGRDGTRWLDRRGGVVGPLRSRYARDWIAPALCIWGGLADAQVLGPAELRLARPTVPSSGMVCAVLVVLYPNQRGGPRRRDRPGADLHPPGACWPPGRDGGQSCRPP